MAYAEQFKPIDNLKHRAMFSNMMSSNGDVFTHRKILSVGASRYVVIPKDFARKYEIRQNDTVKMHFLFSGLVTKSAPLGYTGYREALTRKQGDSLVFQLPRFNGHTDEIENSKFWSDPLCDFSIAVVKDQSFVDQQNTGFEWVNLRRQNSKIIAQVLCPSCKRSESIIDPINALFPTPADIIEGVMHSCSSCGAEQKLFLTINREC